jgi:cell division protein FtsA
MQTNNPNLFVEINDLNFIFAVGAYDENQNLKILEKITIQSEGIQQNRFTNIDNVSEIIITNVELIEKKLKYVFKEVIIVLDIFNFSCVNISGFKKLNGSQVLKENISYILNSLKLAVTENEQQKTILHIFNSRSALDGVKVENLPIGLFGDFYNHELTFFLIRNNDLKNIKKIFNKSNLSIKNIILKNFSEGVQLINKNSIETFFKIKINKETSNITFFDQSSFRYSEHFNFGTNIIFKDIVKICSIENEIIFNFLSNEFSNNRNFDENNYLEEKYFTKSRFRKIRKKLIIDIAIARIEEITNIILNKNINIQSFKQNNLKIYVTIQDKLISDSFSSNFKSYFSNYENSETNLIDDFEVDSLIISTAQISTYGWKKEAIPITQIKNSLITRIFKSIFG